MKRIVKFQTEPVPVKYMNMTGEPDESLKNVILALPGWLKDYTKKDSMRIIGNEEQLPSTNYGRILLNGHGPNNGVDRRTNDFAVQLPHIRIPTTTVATEVAEGFFSLSNPRGEEGAERFYFDVVGSPQLKKPKLYFQTIVASKVELPSGFYIRIPSAN